jgi:hypothetical protein
MSQAEQNVSRVIESMNTGCLIPIKQLSSAVLSEIERETLHVNNQYGIEIDEYQRELEAETQFNTSLCL